MIYNQQQLHPSHNHSTYDQDCYAQPHQPLPMYSNLNCGGSDQQQLVFSNCESMQVLGPDMANVLYNHHESFVINGSSCSSNHLNSSLSTSQTSLPPPPGPSELDDMMLSNNHGFHSSAAAAYAETNHQNSHYYAPVQLIDQRTINNNVHGNGDMGYGDVLDGDASNQVSTKCFCFCICAACLHVLVQCHMSYCVLIIIIYLFVKWWNHLTSVVFYRLFN